MRRSPAVCAPLLGSLAVVLLSGCRPPTPDMERCVDDGNRVVDPALCRADSSGKPGAPYHRYYGGTGSYTPGTFAVGGAAEPEPGHIYSDAAGTVRGGFGSSFSGAEPASEGAVGEAVSAGE